jgi:S-adenosylmethionine/arginine decarboxylase-like enzyme
MFQERQSSGKHLIMDVRDIKIKYDFTDVMELMDYVCSTYQFQVLHKSYYKFDDTNAFTILFLLGESHFSCHTYPERNYIAFDLYTCRDYQDDKEYFSILKLISDYFETNVVYQIIDRGF